MKSFGKWTMEMERRGRKNASFWVILQPEKDGKGVVRLVTCLLFCWLHCLALFVSWCCWSSWEFGDSLPRLLMLSPKKRCPQVRASQVFWQHVRLRAWTGCVDQNHKQGGLLRSCLWRKDMYQKKCKIPIDYFKRKEVTVLVGSV